MSCTEFKSLQIRLKHANRKQMPAQIKPWLHSQALLKKVNSLYFVLSINFSSGNFREHNFHYFCCYFKTDKAVIILWKIKKNEKWPDSFDKPKFLLKSQFFVLKETHTMKHLARSAVSQKYPMFITVLFLSQFDHILQVEVL